VTTYDEDWTEDDMQAALNWRHERSLICSGCGFPLEETTAVGREDAYEAEMIACHACAAAERAGCTERATATWPGSVAASTRQRTEGGFRG
jgi:hypothetical protein